MYRYTDALKNVKGDYCFLLADEDGILLGAKSPVFSQDCQIEYKDFFTAGVSFSEESVGTNSIALSKLCKKDVRMYPDFHYCNKLKTWYEYCIPIKNNVNGYIAVVSVKYPISKALEGFAHLLAVNISADHINMDYSAQDDEGLITQLTGKQNIILKMIAQGLSDEYISKELKISLSAVKHHNQNIFKKLNATCRVDAVVKALLFNEITFSDLLDICF